MTVRLLHLDCRAEEDDEAGFDLSPRDEANLRRVAAAVRVGAGAGALPLVRKVDVGYLAVNRALLQGFVEQEFDSCGANALA